MSVSHVYKIKKSWSALNSIPTKRNVRASVFADVQQLDLQLFPEFSIQETARGKKLLILKQNKVFTGLCTLTFTSYRTAHRVNLNLLETSKNRVEQFIIYYYMLFWVYFVFLTEMNILWNTLFFSLFFRYIFSSLFLLAFSFYLAFVISPSLIFLSVWLFFSFLFSFFSLLFFLFLFFHLMISVSFFLFHPCLPLLYFSI